MKLHQLEQEMLSSKYGYNIKVGISSHLSPLLMNSNLFLVTIQSIFCPSIFFFVRSLLFCCTQSVFISHFLVIVIRYTVTVIQWAYARTQKAIIIIKSKNDKSDITWHSSGTHRISKVIERKRDRRKNKGKKKYFGIFSLHIFLSTRWLWHCLFWAVMYIWSIFMMRHRKYFSIQFPYFNKNDSRQQAYWITWGVFPLH